MPRCVHISRRAGEERQCVRAQGHQGLHQVRGLTTHTILPPVSTRRQREMRRYSDLKKAFLEGHPRCEFPTGCEAPAVDVHHKRGRAGERLLDVDWWAASCRFHNDYAETHTGHALALGWLVRIESTAELAGEATA